MPHTCLSDRYRAAVFIAVFLVFASASPTGSKAGPDQTNARIATCVDVERAKGRSGRACIGQVADRCKADPDNAYIEDRMECDEREFVLWSQLLQRELVALKELLSEAQVKKLTEAHAKWVAYQSAECRLPYALFSAADAVHAGPACTIDVKAERALRLRAWRDALSEGLGAR